MIISHLIWLVTSSFQEAFDFEERSEYFVRLRVTDHKLGFFEKSVAVPIVDVDDHSPVLSL